MESLRDPRLELICVSIVLVREDSVASLLVSPSMEYKSMLLVGVPAAFMESERSEYMDSNFTPSSELDALFKMESKFLLAIMTVTGAAYAALHTNMEETFRSRATGKLKQARKAAYSPSIHMRRDESSVYGIESGAEDGRQCPKGKLNPIQADYIKAFLQAITGLDDHSLDLDIRAVHKLGIWRHIVS